MELPAGSCKRSREDLTGSGTEEPVPHDQSEPADRGRGREVPQDTRPESSKAVK